MILIIFDVYLLARELGYGASLKTVENTLMIERPYELQDKRKIAIKLWNRFKRFNDLAALKTLIEYNRQDTINLYPIAEHLVRIAEKKLDESS